MEKRGYAVIDRLGISGLVSNLLATHATYPEIIKTIKEETGHEVSHQCLTRFKRKWSGAQEMLARAGAEAEGLARVLKNQPAEQISEAAVGVLLAKLMQRINASEGELETADILQVGSLLTRTVRADQTRRWLEEKKRHNKWIRTRTRKVANTVKNELKKKNISTETIDKIERDILGLIPDDETASK